MKFGEFTENFCPLIPKEKIKKQFHIRNAVKIKENLDS